jgi:uncharacterized membrane protein YeaQ/YmgE (transglycosylase-associated protein family)
MEEVPAMLDLFGWDVGMSGLAVILLVAGAIVIGAIPLFVGEARTGYEWLATAAAALLGGWLGSEAFGGISTLGPAFEGLYLVPALIGGVVLGAVVDVLVRYVSGGRYTHAPRPI